MPRAFLNFDKHSDISDSDTEMPYSRSPSPISGPDDVTPDTSTTYGSDVLVRGVTKNNSSLEDFSQTPGISSSSHSAFHKICRKQTTPDTSQSNGTASDCSMNSFIPISPPNASDSRRRYHSRRLRFPPLYSDHLSTSLPGSCFAPPLGLNPNPTGSSSLTSDHRSPPLLDNDPAVFLHSDTRIPFSNYFNNLVKLLHTAAAKGQLGKSRNISTTSKNVFNFYWNRNSTENESKCSSTNDTSDENESPEKSNSSYLRTSDRSESGDDRTAMTSPQTLGNNNNNTGASEGSPILSGHFAQSPQFFKTSPNISQGLMPPFPQYASSPRAPLHLQPTPGSYPLMHSHNAYVQMPGFRFQNPNTEKTLPVKKYKCDVCGKAFSRSNTLVTHKRIHTGAKPFKCEICGRAFRQPGNLTRHRLTHTSVKPYVCPQCNKAFNRASNLNTHMRTHSNYRPFTCTWCGKGFNQKVDLKIHSYTHTGKKPVGYRH